MDLTFTEEQRTFRRQVREFMKEHLPRDVWLKTGGFGEEHDEEFYQKLAEHGFIGLQWPREYGGQGRSHLEYIIFMEELAYAGAPQGRYTGSVVFFGESLVTYGSEALKREFIPRIARGEIKCCWALTEPDAGTDSLALKTIAKPVAGGYRVSGQKVFISGAHLADYALVAVRIGEKAGTQRGREGINLVIVDMHQPGVQVSPLHNMGGWFVNEVVFDDVEIPSRYVVGDPENGWRNFLTTLNLERSGIAIVGILMRYYDMLHEFTAAHRSQVPVRLQAALADYGSQIEAARIMSYRTAWMQANGKIPDVGASVTKLLVSKLALNISMLGMDILGHAGVVQGEEAPLYGFMEKLYRGCHLYLSGGGTLEAQRNLIATRGLGLPKSY